MSTKESKILCLLPQEQRPALINAFLNQINRKKSIGEDLIALLLSFYGDETFYWKISGNDFDKLLDENNDETLKSQVFSIQNVFFYLEIKKPEQQYVVLSVKIVSQPKHSIMTVFARIFCEAPNLRKEYRDVLEAPISFEWDADTLYLSEITQLNLDKKQLTFGCCMDILKLQQITDIDNNNNNNSEKDKSEIKPIINYIKDITIKRVANYTWNLSNIEQACCREYDSDKDIVVQNYYSPLFDNYDIICCHSNDTISLGLELTHLPQHVGELRVKWDYFVDYDGQILKYWSNTYFSYSNKFALGSPINCLEFVDDVESFDITLLSIKSSVTILAVSDENSQEIDKLNWKYYGVENIKNDWIDHIQKEKEKKTKVSISCIDHDTNFNQIKIKQDLMMNKIECIENTMSELMKEMKRFMSTISALPKKQNGKIDLQFVANYQSSQSVMRWLKEINLSQYYDIFIKNGFDSIEMIKEISTKNDLNYIGVTIKAHQIKLINAISKL